MNDMLRQWLVNFGCYIFGLVTGATSMIYVYEQPKPTKPVVTVAQVDTISVETIQNSAGKDMAVVIGPREIEKIERQLHQLNVDTTTRFAQLKADYDARMIRVEYRNNEFAAALRKAAGVKQTWDLKLGEVGK